MTAYIEIASQTYPLYEGDIRLQHPNTSFPRDFIAPDGYAVVLPTPRPVVGHASNVVEGRPSLIGGVWTQQWVVTDASADQLTERTEAQWGAVRTKRNRMLADCDWTQLPDAPVNATDWATYRQALRDITTQTDPFNIVWPQEPA